MHRQKSKRKIWNKFRGRQTQNFSWKQKHLATKNHNSHGKSHPRLLHLRSPRSSKNLHCALGIPKQEKTASRVTEKCYPQENCTTRLVKQRCRQKIKNLLTRYRKKNRHKGARRKKHLGSDDRNIHRSRKSPDAPSKKNAKIQT